MSVVAIKEITGGFITDLIYFLIDEKYSFERANLVNDKNVQIYYEGDGKIYDYHQIFEQFKYSDKYGFGLTFKDVKNVLMEIRGQFKLTDGLCDWEKVVSSRKNGSLSLFPIDYNWQVNESIIDALNNDEVFLSLENEEGKAIYLYFFLCKIFVYDMSYFDDDDYEVICDENKIKQYSLDENNHALVCFAFSIIYCLLLKKYCSSIGNVVVSKDNAHFYNVLKVNNIFVTFDATRVYMNDMTLLKLGIFPNGITEFFTNIKCISEKLNCIFDIFCHKYLINNTIVSKLLEIQNFNETTSADDNLINSLIGLTPYYRNFLRDYFKIYYKVSLDFDISKVIIDFSNDKKYVIDLKNKIIIKIIKNILD